MQDNQVEENKFIDLKGKICPLPFVYTKLALEQMKSGEILKIELDYPPAFINVPKSLKIQNLGEVILEKDRDLSESKHIKIMWIKKY